jgi:hypothetical protein
VKQLDPGKALKNLRDLQGAGYEVDPKQIELLTDLDRRNRNVRQVWTCRTCDHVYETLVKLSGISHLCSSGVRPQQRTLRLEWEG